MYETHIGIPLLTKKHVKPKSSSVADHLLLYNHSTSYDDFSILTLENKMFLLEFKKSLLIMKDKPSPNRNISFATCTYSTEPSNKVGWYNFICFNCSYVILIEWTFFVI